MHKPSARLDERYPSWMWTPLRILQHFIDNRKGSKARAITWRDVLRFGHSRLRRVAGATAKNFLWYPADLFCSSLSLIVVAVFRVGFDVPYAPSPQYEAVVFAVPLFVSICAIVFPLSGL